MGLERVGKGRPGGSRGAVLSSASRAFRIRSDFGIWISDMCFNTALARKGLAVFNWRPSGEGNTAALLFLIGTAISGRRNKACNSQSAIPARGHGFNGFNVFNGSKDIMATCIRHILQAVVALHICAMWLPRAGSILKQNHDESIAKMCKFHAKCMR